MEERYYSPEEVAEKYNVSGVVMRKWLREGKLKGIKLGGKNLAYSGSRARAVCAQWGCSCKEKQLKFFVNSYKYGGTAGLQFGNDKKQPA